MNYHVLLLMKEAPQWFCSVRRTLRTMCLTLTLLGCVACPAAFAATPKMCIPNAAGVPGSGGAPDWWTSNQTTVTGQTNTAAYQPYDPRWRGAMSLDYGSGSISQVEYRSLYKQNSGQNYVYLSWQVKSTPSIAIDNTKLYVGLAPTTANADGVVIGIVLKADSTGITAEGDAQAKSALDSQPSSSVKYFDVAVTKGTGTNASTWTTLTPTPSWLTDTTRVWISNTNPNSWTVQMRVPVLASSITGTDITNGIGVGNLSSFRMWHYAQVGVVLPANSTGFVPYTWPRPDDPSNNPLQYAFVKQGLSRYYPDPNTWGEFATVYDPSQDSTCTGIHLANDRIGTRNTTYNSKINLVGNNTFFAEPQNKSVQPVPENVLSATFRLANWGSQVGDVNAASWTAPNVLKDVLASTPSGTTISIPANGAYGKIEADWNPSQNLEDICPFTGKNNIISASGTILFDAQSCPNPNPTRILHQCMLVKLKGPGLNFMRDSAARNMDFVKASQFTREAEISVVGLNDLAAGNRDVYLYVERRNMPQYDPKHDSEQLIGQTGMQREVQADLAKGKVPAMAHERIAKVMPTYIVNVYHDSGVRMDKDSVLVPQTSFGYFISHEGESLGWSDRLSGAQPVNNRDDFFVVSVGNNSAVRVSSKIETIEFKKYSIGISGGISLPHGNVSNTLDPGPAATFAFEYRLTPQDSVEILLGRHWLKGASTAPDVDVTQTSTNYKRYLTGGGTKFFVNAGAGSYAFSPGSTNSGVNAGGGLQYLLSSEWAIEGAYNYHKVSNSALSNPAFSTVQVGVRYRF